MPSNSVLEPLDLSLGRSTKSARKAGDWPEEPNGRQKRVVLMVYSRGYYEPTWFIGDQSNPSVQPRVNGISINEYFMGWWLFVQGQNVFFRIQ